MEFQRSIAQVFESFCSAQTFQECLTEYHELCKTVGIQESGPIYEFYAELKKKIKSWKAKSLWKIFDEKAKSKVYKKGSACLGTKVLVIGAGPCGLRTAIELQLLGAQVVLIEKRSLFTRNNVLRLWPFVIADLKNLGSKQFVGNFAGDSTIHIPIQQLQCMLVKVALLLGVQVHANVAFVKPIEPTSEECGWRAQVQPEDCPVSNFEYDVLIGAEGRQNTLEGFKRVEFRGKFAIAITVNFVNNDTEEENRVKEITGGESVFKQPFFKKLREEANIDLENILYFKDETHYFVMTAKKQNLLDNGVLLANLSDPNELLAPNNVDTEKLQNYARKASEYSINNAITGMKFATNQSGKPDVAIFDFTIMFGAENSCRVVVNKTHRLLFCLVGDSLLNPFWPTGSGCARGFLSCLDAAFVCKLFANTRNSILGAIAQRESVYRLLAQATVGNLKRDVNTYTLDPATRYTNLNKSAVEVDQIKHLLISDDPELYEQSFMDIEEVQVCRRGSSCFIRRSWDNPELGMDSLKWIKLQLKGLHFLDQLTKASDCFTDGRVLCTLLHRYRPNLIDIKLIKEKDREDCNKQAFAVLEKEFGISRVMSSKTSKSLVEVPSFVWVCYLEKICNALRRETPQIDFSTQNSDQQLRADNLGKTKSESTRDLSAIFKSLN